MTTIRYLGPAILALSALAACAASAPSGQGTGGSTAAAEAACRAAGVEQIGRTDLTILGAEPADAFVEVYIGVPGATAPWRCISTPAGEVREIMFTGSEGAL